MNTVNSDALKRRLETRKANANPLDYKAKAIYAECITMVENMEAIEAEPVRHGKWIKNEWVLNRVTCSECKCYFDSLEADLYCPNCGAKMDLEGE